MPVCDDGAPLTSEPLSEDEGGVWERRSLRRAAAATSTSASFRPSSNQVCDTLTEHLSLYHTAQAKQGNDTRAAVLKHFASLSLDQRRQALTCLDAEWIAVVNEMAIVRARRRLGDRTRFLVLQELLRPATAATRRVAKAASKGKGKRKQSKKKKRKAADDRERRREGGDEGVTARARNALCTRTSSEAYHRLLGCGEESAALLDSCFLFSANAAARANAFALADEALEDPGRIFAWCGKISLGSFLSRDQGDDAWKRHDHHETHWLQSLGYYTLPAYLASKIELLLWRSFHQQHSGSVVTSIPTDQHGLNRALRTRIFLHRLNGEGEDDCGASSFPKQIQKLKRLIWAAADRSVVSSGRLYLSRPTIPELNALAFECCREALEITSRAREAALLAEVEGEERREREEEEKAARKREKRRQQRKRKTEEARRREAEAAAAAAAKEREEEEAMVAKQKAKQKALALEEKAAEAVVLGGDSPAPRSNAGEEASWMGAIVPEAHDSFSWANIFGAQDSGASFYWGVTDACAELVDAGSEKSFHSINSSTTRELVLGSLLSNLDQDLEPVEDASERAEAPAAPALRVSTSAARSPDPPHGARPSSSSSSSRTVARSEASSPTAAAAAVRARRPSLEGGAAPRWLLRRRSSEVLLLSARTEPKVNSSTSFFMSSNAPPRSLLRIAKLGELPGGSSPYRQVFLSREKWWESHAAGPAKSAAFTAALDARIDLFVCGVRNYQRGVMARQRSALSRVLEAVHVIWPRARAKIFGSVASGLSLPKSDVDVVLWLPPVRSVGGLKNILEVGILESGNAEKESFVQQLARQLSRQQWVVQESLRVVDRTAIPLVSVECTDEEGGPPLSVDISFQSQSHHGLLAAAIVRELTSILPTLAPLILCLKHFLSVHKMSKAYTGGLGSYVLTLIVASFLVHQPPGVSVGRLLLDFLHFFGRAPEIQRFRFGLAGVGGIPPHEAMFDPLCVEDPLQPGKNAAQNCFRITQIQKQVARAYGNAEGLLLGGKLDEGGDLLEKIFGCPF